jgi:hypothetical protein
MTERYLSSSLRRSRPEKHTHGMSYRVSCHSDAEVETTRGAPRPDRSDQVEREIPGSGSHSLSCVKSPPGSFNTSLWVAKHLRRRRQDRFWMVRVRKRNGLPFDWITTMNRMRMWRERNKTLRQPRRIWLAVLLFPSRNDKKVTHHWSNLAAFLEEWYQHPVGDFRFQPITDDLASLGPSAIDVSLSTLCSGMLN